MTPLFVLPEFPLRHPAHLDRSRDRESRFLPARLRRQFFKRCEQEELLVNLFSIAAKVEPAHRFMIDLVGDALLRLAQRSSRAPKSWLRSPRSRDQVAGGADITAGGSLWLAPPSARSAPLNPARQPHSFSPVPSRPLAVRLTCRRRNLRARSKVSRSRSGTPRMYGLRACRYLTQPAGPASYSSTAGVSPLVARRPAGFICWPT